MALHPHDLQLARDVHGGSRAAFCRFFDLYFPRLYRFLLRRTGGDTGVAEEITQATLVTAIEALHQYRGEASLLTWLCTIARNELTREQRRLGRTLEMPTTADDATVLDAAQALMAQDDTPEQAMLQAQLRADVHAILDRLLPAHAECLELKYALGFSMQEIAQHLGRTEKAVEGLLSRARSEFRSLFAMGYGGSTTDAEARHGH